MARRSWRRASARLRGDAAGVAHDGRGRDASGAPPRRDARGGARRGRLARRRTFGRTVSAHVRRVGLERVVRAADETNQGAARPVEHFLARPLRVCRAWTELSTDFMAEHTTQLAGALAAEERKLL